MRTIRAVSYDAVSARAPARAAVASASVLALGALLRFASTLSDEAIGAGLAVGIACTMSFLVGRSSIDAPPAREVSYLQAELHLELARGRRHGHALAIVRIAAPVDPAWIQALVRVTDRSFVEPSGIHVLMPHTTADQAWQWVARTAAAVGDLDATVVAFPDDELTAGALVEALRSPRRRSA